MTLSVPGIPASCEKFPHSSQLNFWSTESIFNQFSVFLKTLNALCVCKCLQYKHPRSIKKVIRSDKPVTLLLLLWSHKCDFDAEPRSRIIATSAVKGLKQTQQKFCQKKIKKIWNKIHWKKPWQRTLLWQAKCSDTCKGWTWHSQKHTLNSYTLYIGNFLTL
jgi:hypothetical protein